MRGNDFHGTVGTRSWGRLTARLSRLGGLLGSKLDVQKAPHLLDEHSLGPIGRIQGHLLQTLERRGQGIHPLEALLGGRKVIDILGSQRWRSRHMRFLQLVVFALEGCGELVNAALLSSGSRSGLNSSSRRIKEGAIPQVDTQGFTATVGTQNGNELRHVNSRHTTSISKFDELIIGDTSFGNSFPLRHHPVVNLLNVRSRTRKRRVGSMAPAGKRLTRLVCRR